MELNENSRYILEQRYLMKDENGKVIESPEEMCQRVAKHVASKEENKKWEKEFFNALMNLDFLPNTPTLVNAGKKNGLLSACFFIPLEDSLESIMEALRVMVDIHSKGGGTGFNFSNIRPKDAIIKSNGGKAAGPVAFLGIFDAATTPIKQSGVRRGANMGAMRVDHPDIIEFLNCKRVEGQTKNFNISCWSTKEFMEAVLSGGTYELKHPAVAPRKIPAKEVFDIIVENAWRNGEPGLIFGDKVNEKNQVPGLGELHGVNPCSEVPLFDYEACNLLSINLSKFVINNQIDYKRLGKIVEVAVRFGDNIIDVNYFPHPSIEKMAKANRKIGLGVMGWADMLLMLGIRYDSDLAIEKARELMKFIQTTAREVSKALGEEKGDFPNIKKSIFKDHMRNATVTAIAPTGSLSRICNCSGGIEPLFDFEFTTKQVDTEFHWIHPLYKKFKNAGPLPDYFVAAHNITPEWHVRMQAAFQEYTCLAISKTINMPNTATKKDVEEAFKLAYRLNCKSLTVYRDGSREEQVYYKMESRKIEPRKRPAVTLGLTEKAEIGCGTLWITVNEDAQGICEVFANTGKFGGCPGQSEAISRLISLALRSGIKLEAIIDQLKHTKCPAASRSKKLSCPDAIAKVLERATQKKVTLDVIKDNDTLKGSDVLRGECPDCGGTLIDFEGCHSCRSCGYSKCV
jgi:ribonucleoside-diphosphate reductase alpha chain